MFVLDINTPDIKKIIEQEHIITHFQPILSVRKRSVIGFEALSRGIDPNTKTIIPPNILFEYAAKQQLTLELDRLCRKLALANFKLVQQKVKNSLLFLNFDTTIIDKGVVGSGNLLNMVRCFNVDPQRIVIEIKESEANNLKELDKFINNYKNYGFIIALDDIGSGHSNLNRISLVKPDLLKLDAFLIRNINKEFHKQEVFKSLVNLAKKIGALVVAEGIEGEDESICALELGADMLQGYYFDKPSVNILCTNNDYKDKIRLLANKFKNHMIIKTKTDKMRRMEYRRIASNILAHMDSIDTKDINAKLSEIISNYPIMDCIYILNEQGVQISNTVCNDSKLFKRRVSIFRPAAQGTDHSFKKYYYLLKDSGSDYFFTEPYISMASGNLCVTISTLFQVKDNNYILCADIITDFE
ncbi:diguanylate phosphodiesterase [Desulfofarcimen acetoxidans DSM 771]|uniref:Diguanylate phosphodiesterase n=1 Tax=Desulfofarcimen acetoxidans (strain ATCC 49208 / DSM 771 / KCTC 5769 / VKM B-1644 / 5575) TaxID=485916 RepID=C8W451_DESAS|nr:EAL domain-containing protein [Desulfofarcimen acetoxidans]ACV61919.1 diguanylate phosphodiesterase [Desulfofarcimen acetoxidans DSM 771]